MHDGWLRYDAFEPLFLAGIAVLVLGIRLVGTRWKEEPLTSAALLGLAIAAGLAGLRAFGVSWSDLAAGAGPKPSHPSGMSLLGAVGVGAVVTSCAWRLLGKPGRVPDAWGLVLPVAVMVGRMGCFLSGCCHGTVTGLPWGIRYPSWSHVFQHQVEAGLLSPTARVSLPVHPVQAYEILFLALLTWALVRARPRLRRDGSTFFMMVGLYCAFRCCQEFLRFGDADIAGLKTVQLGLAVVSAVSMSVLLIRERRPAEPGATGRLPRAPSPQPCGELKPRWSRLLPLLAICAPGVALSAWWFSPLERTALALALLPVVAHLAAAAGEALAAHLPQRLARVVPAGAAAVALSGAAPLVDQDDEEGGGRSAIRLTLGGGYGEQQYQNCDGPINKDAYWSGQVGMEVRHYTPADVQFFVGAKAYTARVWRLIEGKDPSEWNDEFGGSPGVDQWAPTPYGVWGLHPYVGVDFRWFGIAAGPTMFASPELQTSDTILAGSLRVGPADVFFIELLLLHDEYFAPAAVSVEFGLGFTLGPLGRMRLGGDYVQGSYASTEHRIPLGDVTLTLAPRVSYFNGRTTKTEHMDGTQETYHEKDGACFFGLGLGIEAPISQRGGR
jgi:phosphatidylglycerol:prolipoprotein diacylglycerol transferase